MRCNLITQVCLAASVMAAAALPASAQSYRFAGNMIVTPAGQDSFYVSGVPAQTPVSHWCAAAEYAVKVLGAGYEQRMYVVGGQKRGERRVLISLSPAGTASEAAPIKQRSIFIDGANRKVNAGLADCRDLRRVSDF